jgi:isocitrate lyase
MGIDTPVHAKIVEKAGFDYAYLGGYDVSLALLGLPDVGLITETEMVATARNVARAVDIPVVCDADTGYGNAINVIRTVQNFEAAGVAAIHIEDQVSPKRCGHVAGKMIISLEEAVGKLKAALESRQDQDFVIIARTDAVAAMGGGLDEAIRRGKEYARIGCDMVFCEFPSADLEYPKRFAQEMHRAYPGFPLYFNYSANLGWHQFPLTTFEALADIGYKAMHVSQACLRPSLLAVWDYAADLKTRGVQAEIDLEKRVLKHPLGTINDFAGFPKFKTWEATYLPTAEVEKKYKGAIGL